MGSSSHSLQPAVALEGVSKTYENVPVLEPLSLSIHPGETVAVLGPSGAGKTTLFRLMAGTLQPSSGQVFLHGKSVAAMRPGRELAQLVGMVPQQFDLIPHLSALHNVLAGRLGQWGTLQSLTSLVFPRDRQVALAALGRVGIGGLAYLRAARLSGGEQQRAAIARLLVQDPAIVLADEPVASLDPARAQEVLRLLVSIAQESGKTLIASLHNIDLVRSHLSRVVGLRNGALEFDVPTSQITDGMLRELYDLQGLRSGA